MNDGRLRLLDDSGGFMSKETPYSVLVDTSETWICRTAVSQNAELCVRLGTISWFIVIILRSIKQIPQDTRLLPTLLESFFAFLLLISEYFGYGATSRPAKAGIEVAQTVQL